MSKEPGYSNITLKPQDVFVLLKIIAHPREVFSQANLSKQLQMSVSMINDSLQRASFCQLYDRKRNTVYVDPLYEFIAHGLRHVFPVRRGGLVPGIPTSSAAPPLESKLTKSREWPPVWPHPNGTERGYEILPLYRTAPDIALQQPKFYELLALVDAIREGRPRERQLALEELRDRFDAYRDSRPLKRSLDREAMGAVSDQPDDFRKRLDHLSKENGLVRLPGGTFPGVVVQSYKSTIFELGYRMEFANAVTKLTLRFSPANLAIAAMVQYAIEPNIPQDVHEHQLKKEAGLNWDSTRQSWCIEYGSDFLRFPTKIVTNEKLAKRCIQILLSGPEPATSK
jgi:hypothetical protein